MKVQHVLPLSSLCVCPGWSLVCVRLHTACVRLQVAFGEVRQSSAHSDLLNALSQLPKKRPALMLICNGDLSTKEIFQVVQTWREPVTVGMVAGAAYQGFMCINVDDLTKCSCFYYSSPSASLEGAWNVCILVQVCQQQPVTNSDMIPLAWSTFAFMLYALHAVATCQHAIMCCPVEISTSKRKTFNHRRLHRSRKFKSAIDQHCACGHRYCRVTWRVRQYSHTWTTTWVVPAVHQNLD